MNTPRRFLQFVIILALLLGMIPVGAYAVNPTTDSEDKITGENRGLGVNYSAIAERDDYVVVNIKFRSVKEIAAEIDYATQTISIKSISQKDGTPISVTKQDIFVLKMLGKSLGPVTSRTGDALASVLSFLSEAPPGEVVDISVGGHEETRLQPQALQPKAIASLCDRTGEQVTGRYDTCRINRFTQRCVRGTRKKFKKRVQVGPCYFQPNECIGRCGPGCNAPPNATIQRFAQDCLNHDLCRRKTGRNLGPCRDEWVAAADDFAFAPDCGDVTGTWNDNLTRVWDLNQILLPGSRFINGSVDVTTPQCGTWAVSGAHEGANVSLTATNPPPIEGGCCTAFTYIGTLDSCKTASGTWANECGLNGDWNMSREATTSVR